MSGSPQPKWQPPDELRYPCPRSVRLASQGIAMVVLGAIVLAAGLGLSILAGHQRQLNVDRNRLIAEQGVQASAIVTRLWEIGGKTPASMVSYRFHSPDGDVSGESPLISSYWKQLHAGGPIEIRYVPGRAQVNQPLQGAPGPGSYWMPWVALAILGWQPVLFWVLIRRQWRLLSSGSTVQATVKTVIRGGKKTRVTYEFKLPNGEWLAGKSSSTRQPEPNPNEEICVLYDPENPNRNAMYPLDLVRAG